MKIYIRQALKDDAKQVAPLIYDAIGEIASRLTGEQNEDQIIDQLEVLFKRTDNRHSYINTYVAENEETHDILGILVLYTGEDGVKLDAALQQWLQQKNAPITSIDAEAYPDEFYVDTICVHEASRGLGLGTKLLDYAEEVARIKGYSKLSLNVDTQKESARRLYENLGYVITEHWTIIDEPFYHMVKTIK